jgi:hypothetical protein
MESSLAKATQEALVVAAVVEEALVVVADPWVEVVKWR